MRPLRHDQTTFERKAKKDAPAAVFSRAACVSRTPADASRPALSGWGRPAWSHRVNLLSTMLGFLTVQYLDLSVSLTCDFFFVSPWRMRILTPPLLLHGNFVGLSILFFGAKYLYYEF